MQLSGQFLFPIQFNEIQFLFLFILPNVHSSSICIFPLNFSPWRVADSLSEYVRNSGLVLVELRAPFSFN